MKITHRFHSNKIEKEVSEDTTFFLSNKAGGYFSLGLNTKYRGLFCRFNNDMFKILDNITISEDIKGITNNFWNIQRIYEKNYEEFFMPMHTNSLVYELKHSEVIDFAFDVRKPYDSSVWGRNYEICPEEQKIIIKFQKTSDERDGPANDQSNYTIFIVIRSDKALNHEIVDNWKKLEYEFDKNRNSGSYERYVYNALKIKSKRVIITASTDRSHALNESSHVLHNLEKLKEFQRTYYLADFKSHKKNQVSFAYKCASDAIDNLLILDNKKAGIYAGLPWFFQFWARDEAISLKSLMIKKQYGTSKKILERLISQLGIKGNIETKNSEQSVLSVDAPGWIFQRFNDLTEILSKEKKLHSYFTKTEMLKIGKLLEESLNLFVKSSTKNGFLMAKMHETWMDSVYGNDTRLGARIELQTLLMKMYSIVYELTKKDIYKKLEISLAKNVKKYFWDGKILKDGIDDPTIRPNIFIAYYIYPDLLSSDEWKVCFDNILPNLWVDWGGLTTIDQSDRLFCEYHTGEDPRGYHRGDSWFWINNLAAICMHRLDSEKYKDYINKILEASTGDILFSGAIACNAELSSASSLKSQGCLDQAWSNAMFVELAEELSRK